MSRTTLIISMIAALAIASSPAYSVPRILQYQGRLTDAAGEPLSKPVDVTFAIYGSADGGEPLWLQTFESLALDNGRFSVLLGGDDAQFTSEFDAALEEGADLFLGIQVGKDPEMSPRQQIASVAYALRAGAAEVAESANSVAGMPGIAFNTVHRVSIPAGGSVSVVSVSITTPAPGFVRVSAGGTLILGNSSGTGAQSHVNVGEVPDAVPDTTMGLVIAQVDGAAPRVNHYVPFNAERVFEKPAGTHEFHLNVRNVGVGPVSANRPSITVMFFPISYAGGGGEDGAVTSKSRRP